MPETSGGKVGAIVKKRPGEYPRTPQQKLFSKVATICGITKGISKKELMDAMKNCVPRAYKKLKKES